MADEDFTPEELELLDQISADLKAITRHLSNSASAGEKNSGAEPMLVNLTPSEIEATMVMKPHEHTNKDEQIADLDEESLDLINTKKAVHVTEYLTNCKLGADIEDQLLKPFVPKIHPTECKVAQRSHWFIMMGMNSIEQILAKTDELQLMLITIVSPRLPPKPPDINYTPFRWLQGFICSPWWGQLVTNIKTSRFLHPHSDTPPQVFLPNLLQFQRDKPVQQVERALDLCGFDINDDLVLAVLHRNRTDWKPAYVFFIWVSRVGHTRNGYLPSLDVYNEFIDILGKMKRFEEVDQVLDEMIKRAGLIDEVVFGTLVHRYKHVEDAELSHSSFKENQSIYHMLLQSLFSQSVNADECMLTRMQEMSLDYHFTLEQEVGSATHAFFGFNGIVGVWRIAAINETEGWKDSTTVEDMDLAVRTNLRRWIFLYLGDLQAKSKLPSTLRTFRFQQHCWSCGPTLFRKMVIKIIKNKKIRFWKKVYVIYSLFFVRKIIAHMVTFSFYCLVVPLIILVIGHEGEGSLYCILKTFGWATGLYAADSDWSLDFSFLKATIHLTNAGRERMQDIIELLFKYIELLQKYGVCKWIFDELSAICETKFHYQDKAHQILYIANIASEMQKYPLKDWLAESSMPSKCSQSIIQRILNQLSQNKVQIFWESKIFEGHTDQVEPLYGSAYSLEKIIDSVIQGWVLSAPDENMHLTAPNIFIPTDLSLKNGQEKVKFPVLLSRSSYSAVLHIITISFENVTSLHLYFNVHDLEDKVNFNGGGNVTRVQAVKATQGHTGNKATKNSVMDKGHMAADAEIKEIGVRKRKRKSWPNRMLEENVQ